MREAKCSSCWRGGIKNERIGGAAKALSGTDAGGEIAKRKDKKFWVALRMTRSDYRVKRPKSTMKRSSRS